MKKFPHILKVERLLSEPINGFLNPQWSPLSRSGAQVRAILYLTTTATQPPLPPFPFPAKGLTLCRGKPFKPHHFCNKLYEIIALANFCGCFFVQVVTPYLIIFFCKMFNKLVRKPLFRIHILTVLFALLLFIFRSDPGPITICPCHARL